MVSLFNMRASLIEIGGVRHCGCRGFPWASQTEMIEGPRPMKIKNDCLLLLSSVTIMAQACMELDIVLDRWIALIVE